LSAFQQTGNSAESILMLLFPLANLYSARKITTIFTKQRNAFFWETKAFHTQVITYQQLAHLIQRHKTLFSAAFDLGFVGCLTE
jgi:hypothetical protein